MSYSANRGTTGGRSYPRSQYVPPTPYKQQYRGGGNTVPGAGGQSTYNQNKSQKIPGNEGFMCTINHVTLQLLPTEMRVLACSQTYPIRDRLKGLGFRWHTEGHACWVKSGMTDHVEAGKLLVDIIKILNGENELPKEKQPETRSVSLTQEQIQELLEGVTADDLNMSSPEMPTAKRTLAWEENACKTPPKKVRTETSREVVLSKKEIDDLTEGIFSDDSNGAHEQTQTTKTTTPFKNTPASFTQTSQAVVLTDADRDALLEGVDLDEDIVAGADVMLASPTQSLPPTQDMLLQQNSFSQSTPPCELTTNRGGGYASPTILYEVESTASEAE
eukprot:comp17190_c0_seq1/m.16083 comp17190_c0_seq1/g.16083  ORF comp17190_c0_seq1/g.16083 comp17190_c0_seq1/m.16083 type:complete len:332 (-) comp17190_c0_seq1:497-1492(-)